MTELKHKTKKKDCVKITIIFHNSFFCFVKNHDLYNNRLTYKNPYAIIKTQ